MTEQELTKAILDRLSVMPEVWVWRTNTGVAKANGFRIRFGKLGGGDITGILQGGRHFEIEVKLPAGTYPVTPEQETHGKRVLAMGGLWVVVRSVDEAVAAIHEALS